MAFEKLLADDSPDSAASKQKPTDADLFGDSSLGIQGCVLREQDDKYFSVIKKLVKEGTAKIKAQPKLVTLNGRAASFSAGGEIPLPVPQSAGTATIEWKKYGTQIDFAPCVLDRETLRLEIRATLSKLDENHGITVAGTTVPGIKSNSIDTACKIKTGQIAVFSGMRQTRVFENSANSAAERKGRIGSENGINKRNRCGIYDFDSDQTGNRGADEIEKAPRFLIEGLGKIFYNCRLIAFRLRQHVPHGVADRAAGIIDFRADHGRRSDHHGAATATGGAAMTAGPTGRYATRGRATNTGGAYTGGA